jgi:hypothetical protein
VILGRAIGQENSSERRTILQKTINDKKVLRKAAFTACTAWTSLLEPSIDAAENAARLATILLLNARSSFDKIQNARKCSEKLYKVAKSISWGQHRCNPNISGGMIRKTNCKTMSSGNNRFSFRGFLREKHETNNSITQPQLQKGRQ